MINVRCVRGALPLCTVLVALTARAGAGCPAWAPTSPTAGLSAPVHAALEWTPPGAPGLPSEIIAGGAFQNAGAFAAAGGEPLNFIARWRGGAWAPLGAGMNGTVNALALYDPDGAGPAQPLVIAGGAFTSADGASANRVAAWNGSSWSALGAGMDGEVLALAMWDPDGEGPGAPLLVAGGVFTIAGGGAAHRIAAWNGAAWQPLGAGMNDAVAALAAWDADGEGGAPPVLAAGGAFTSAGGAPASRVATWSGGAWSALGAGVDASVTALASWSGAARAGGSELVVGGDFATAGGIPARGVARWSGASWSAMGPGLDGDVAVLRPWVTGGGAPVLLAGGLFRIGEGITIQHIAVWDGAAWASHGSMLNDAVKAFSTWTPTSGAAQLVAAGRFTTAMGQFTNRVARLDDDGWLALGDGLNFSVNSLTAWDPDGAGSAPVELVLAGPFTTVNNRRVAGPVRWRDGAWSVFGDGARATIGRVATWDPDGAGPAHGLLVAVGGIALPGQFLAPAVATWNGQAWTMLGTQQSLNPVAVAGWDPDGAAGPELPRIIVGGGSANRVYLWTGGTWETVGESFNGPVQAIASWDPDGAGPQPARIVAAGRFSQVNNFAVNNIAIWSGLAWFEMTTGLRDPQQTAFVNALTSWAPIDGGPEQLIAGGRFTMAGNVAAHNVARWTGTAWRNVGAGFDVEPAALITWRPDPASAVQLAAAGSFSVAGGQLAGFFATAEDNGPFIITAQPLPLSSGAGMTAQFAFETDPSSGVAYRWRRAGVAIFDGPAPGGGMISGADSPTLSISSVRPADQGVYSCVATSDCGVLTSTGASLVVTCAPDLNGDGVVSAADLGRLLGAWGQSGPDVDVTGDGVVNATDLGVLLGGWGVCP